MSRNAVISQKLKVQSSDPRELNRRDHTELLRLKAHMRQA